MDSQKRVPRSACVEVANSTHASSAFAVIESLPKPDAVADDLERSNLFFDSGVCRVIPIAHPLGPRARELGVAGPWHWMGSEHRRQMRVARFAISRLRIPPLS